MKRGQLLDLVSDIGAGGWSGCLGGLGLCRQLANSVRRRLKQRFPGEVEVSAV